MTTFAAVLADDTKTLFLTSHAANQSSSLPSLSLAECLELPAAVVEQRAKVRREVSFSDVSAAAGGLVCFLSAATSCWSLLTFVVSAVSIASTFFMISAILASLCVRRKFVPSGEVPDDVRAAV